MEAVQAIAAVSSHWQSPSATAGNGSVAPGTHPTLLPMPRPSRNTARMMENV